MSTRTKGILIMTQGQIITKELQIEGMVFLKICLEKGECII